jgi:hypothetical protein
MLRVGFRYLGVIVEAAAAREEEKLGPRKDVS